MTMKRLALERLSGVWSATPTPFTNNMKIDMTAVRRMAEHHIRLGVKGLFLCGTCGEGPWLTDDQRRALIRGVVGCVKGRMLTAVQVTDNSAARIIENMKMAEAEGADIAVIAPPYFLMNATPENIVALYVEAVRNSPLPVGIYDRGGFGTVFVPEQCLKRIYAEKKVVLIKDSSKDAKRMNIALDARKRNKWLRLLNGDEFDCARYLAAGYDGLLLGGGIFNGYLAGKIVEAVKAGNLPAANRLQNRMNRLMWDVYGGKKCACWLAGLKELLVKMGVFRTRNGLLKYPLTPACKKAIEAALKREADVLLP